MTTDDENARGLPKGLRDAILKRLFPDGIPEGAEVRIFEVPLEDAPQEGSKPGAEVGKERERFLTMALLGALANSSRCLRAAADAMDEATEEARKAIERGSRTYPIEVGLAAAIGHNRAGSIIAVGHEGIERTLKELAAFSTVS